MEKFNEYLIIKGYSKRSIESITKAIEYFLRWCDQDNISDIHFEKSLLHVRKGKGYKERMVPITKQSLQHLQNYLYDARPYFMPAISPSFGGGRGEAAFFVTQSGKRLGGTMMLIRLKQLIQFTGNAELMQKDIHLHTLRHSIATHLLQNGMRLERIKDFLGHGSLDSTQIYTHFIEHMERSDIPITCPDPSGV